ncbi:hypothetical protein PFISCL1PPCAC_13623 [Pristionchus fissidentatus]|uniref:UDP-glucuronosyltransferase n=1 Tax=Pristionchus fissidentatus TaxID=1538716 RepID=A0AAV5VUX0_9BILA|nr:hypothetical protein PFISCL1PPCAC_13623 [Pristionchus fissidentatus]
MRLFLLLSLLCYVQSLKFLAFSTQFARSHANFISKISDVLVDAGHEVVMVAPIMSTSFGGPLAKKARIIEIPQCEEAKRFDQIIDGRMAKNIWVMKHSLQMFLRIVYYILNEIHFITGVMEHPGLMDRLREEKFDAAFSESSDGCGPLVFHLLGIDKWAATESPAIRDGGFAHTHTPSNPAYVPSLMGGRGEQMTFLERLSNTFSFLMADLMVGVMIDDMEASIRKRMPDIPRIKDILPTNSLVFYNSEPLVDFPHPTSARTIDIGGIINSEPYEPLNSTWSAILDLRPKTILISFGSMAKAFSMPDEYKKTIRETVKQFPDVTFIWKYEKPEDHISCGIPNLVESTWVPQRDMLHDRRLSAFITHCGQGSTTETINAGVPVVVIPVLADQLRNSHQVLRNGIGLRLDKTDLEKEGKLGAVITEILNNTTYRENAKRLQRMIADRPFAMSEIFVRNMEFLAKHGPLRQLDHYGRHLNFFQYYLIDVISFVASILVITIIVICVTIRSLFRCFFSPKIKRD